MSETPNYASIAASRNSVASFAFLTWDILITMGDEVEFIWNKPFAPTSYIYLFTRYFAWISQLALLCGVDTLSTSRSRHPSPAECRNWVIWETTSTQVELMAVELLLMMRVHALYNRSRRVAYGLGICYVTEVVVMTVSITLSTINSKSTSNCETIVPLTIIAYGAASLLFELLLLVMTTTKVVRQLRETWRYIPMMRTILRDGLWAFALIFVAIFTNAILYGFVKNALSAVAFPWLLTVSSFSGYRLMLNLRRAGYDMHSDLALTRTGDLEFATMDRFKREENTQVSDATTTTTDGTVVTS
ncbi:hypothetical protein SCHPADRAFT_905633 [Schizopora paradoxa]|uniref:DUF6533 domain-containing protein n=1 Tax=Schizopora paradoxa TaxID=27342 RepID=A0A0H2S4I2_9AGAM|nr:hypothetical protein SCHPADRAFT_905633 [Schizopora paradoxa]